MHERRMSVRRIINAPGTIIGADGAPLCAGRIVDISSGGAKLAASAALPDEFVLLLSGNGQVRRGRHVVWRRENEFGVKFQAAPPLAPSPRPENAAIYLD